MLHSLLTFTLFVYSTVPNPLMFQIDSSMIASKQHLNPELEEYVEQILPGMNGIPAERKAELHEVANAINEAKKKDGIARLLFICTHNSRRSHMSQVWASAAALYYEIDNQETYSGGTEVTAFNIRAVAALQRAGFKVSAKGNENPRYLVSYSADAPALSCYSKKYDDKDNPSKGFIAIMTCSDADQNCPIVPGADTRFLISYEDPKLADDTPVEKERYDERCRQIATEMFYLMSVVKTSQE